MLPKSGWFPENAVGIRSESTSKTGHKTRQGINVRSRAFSYAFCAIAVLQLLVNFLKCQQRGDSATHLPAHMSSVMTYLASQLP